MQSNKSSAQMTDQELIKLVLDSRNKYILEIQAIAKNASNNLNESELKNIAKKYAVNLRQRIHQNSKNSLLKVKLAISDLTFNIHEFNSQSLAVGDKEDAKYILKMVKDLNVSEKKLLQYFIINLYDNIYDAEAAKEKSTYNIRTGRIVADRAFLVMRIATTCMHDNNNDTEDTKDLIKQCCEFVRKLSFADVSEAKMHSTPIFGISYISTYIKALEYLKHLSRRDSSINLEELAYQGEEACLIYGVPFNIDSIYKKLQVQRINLNPKILEKLDELKLQCNIAQGKPMFKGAVKNQAAVIANGYTPIEPHEIEEQEQAAKASDCTRRLLLQFNSAYENATAATAAIAPFVVAGLGYMAARRLLQH